MQIQHRGLTRTTAPDRLPVTVQMVKDQLKISGDLENETIELFIKAAVDYIEGNLGIALISQVWRMTLDHWPGGREQWWDGVRQSHINEIQARGSNGQIELPVFPLISVDTITVDGSTITIGNFFTVDTARRSGRIALKFGATWPTLVDATIAGILIDFTAGYGTTAADVPSDIKLAILRMASHLYSHRGDGCDVKSAYNDSGAKGLLSNYKRVQI